MTFFGRNSRRSSRAFRFGLSPFFARLPVGGVHFEGEPADDDDANEPTPAGTGGAGNAPAAPVNPAPVNPARRAIDPEKTLRERDKAKAANRALLRMLGYDPEKVRIIKTNDPTNPIRFEGAENLDARAAVARAASGGTGTGGGNRRAGGSSAELDIERGRVESFRKQNAALIAYIERSAVVDPIRAACVKYGAIDDDNGRFDDIVSMLSPRFKVEVDFDPEEPDATPEVRIYSVDGTGQPVINPTTQQPETPDSIVQSFLTKRPKFRQANFRAGPGAGGAQLNGPRRAATQPQFVGNGNGNGTKTPEQATADVVGRMFGMSGDDLVSGR